MIARLRHFLQDWIHSLNQYPGAYLIALYTALIWILFIYYEPLDSKLGEILTTCGVVFPLMITGTLVAQINGDDNKRKRISQIIAFVLGIGFYLYLHSLDIFNDTASVDSDAIFIVLSYVVAWFSILGGIVRSTKTKTILTRGWIKECLLNVLIAIVSSLILRGGLSASIGSVDYLFDINVYYKRYQYIGVIAFCLVGVSILLTNLTTIKKVDDYPKIFRFFGLYIFLPLAIIYAAILVTYGAKILITQTWPKGLISWMVMGYTIRCTIVYFLTYPLQTLNSIKKIHTGYFVSILVFLPLLVGAIYQRIDQYGITESRYLLIMISLWIAIVGIGSLIWRSKSWLLMIGGLLILAISSTYTPWSASSLSLISQTHRLEDLLKEVNLRDGTQTTPHVINSNDFTGENTTGYNLEQAGEIISYMASNHGINALQKFYVGTGFEQLDQANTWSIGKIFLQSLGVTGYIIDQNGGSYNPSDNEIPFYLNYNRDNQTSQIPIDGYTKVQFVNSQSGTGYKIDLKSYGDELYRMSSSNDQLPMIKTDNALIIIENLNGIKYKKTNTYSIDYYSLMVFTK